jgi:hypothetical protein
MGCGSKGPAASPGTTDFLCGDATAGILANGSGTFQWFRCDGNNIAATPMQNGKIVSGLATPASANATFIGINVINAADTGWTIYGAQNNAYYECRSWQSTRRGLYIDGGAGDLDFVHWQESAPNRLTTYLYGMHGDGLVPGGSGTYGDHTENIQFHSGIIDGGAGGQSRIYLRHAVNWRFPGLSIVGNNSSVTGPAIDLDQSSGYGLDFSKCWIWSVKPSQTVAGTTCIQVSGQPPAGSSPKTFLITDGAFFVGGANSVRFTGYGNYYSAAAWTYDQTVNGPTADAGLPAVDTLLRGRKGKWQTAAAPAPWSGTVSYRVDADGLVRLKGSVSSTGTGGGPIINALPLGYRPGATIVLAATTSAGSATITVTPAGVVSGSSVPSGQTLYLDGLTFVPHYPLP